MAVRLSFLLLSIVIVTGNAQEYYVTPTPPPNPNCPSGEPCHTLSYYANNSSNLLSGRENVTLIFLEGDHISENKTLEISSFGQLSLVGLRSFSGSNPKVKLSNLTVFFSNGSALIWNDINIQLSEVTIDSVVNVDCKGLTADEVMFSIITNLGNFVSLSSSTLSNSHWVVHQYNSKKSVVENINQMSLFNITIFDVTVYNSGSMSVNVFSSVEVRIRNCTFFNSFGIELILTVYQELENQLETNAFVEVQDCDWYNSSNAVFFELNSIAFSLLINRCTFSEFNKGLSIFNNKSSVNASVMNTYFADSSSKANALLFSSFLPQLDNHLILHNVSIVHNHGSAGVVELIGPARTNLITMNILPCPSGFALSTDELVCDCDEEIQRVATQCVVNNGTSEFYREGTNWIGVIEPGEFNESLAYSDMCPYSYCLPYEVRIDLSNPDSQCAFNRSGVLCGGCPPGLSLAIGSSKCLDCSKNMRIPIGFFVYFIVSGLALVTMIRIFDLNAIAGMFNGVFTYFQTVWINQAIFFPEPFEVSDTSLVLFYRLMKSITAQINLDFGITTCFIVGLDAYGKAWLQYLFPFYLIGLGILITIACQRSTRLTRIFGNHSASLVVSFIKLVFAKILRNTFSVFSFAYVQDHSSNRSVVVWLVDGNVTYSDPLFLLLLLVSLLIAILLCFVCFSVLFMYKLPCSIAKLVPFVEYFVSNLKENHRYWFGLSFMLQLFFVTAVTFLQTRSPVSILAILVVISALLCALSLKVYTKLSLSILEFMSNATVLVVSVGFLATSDSKLRVIYISVSTFIMYILFVSIILYHAYPLTKKLCLALKKANTKVYMLCTSCFAKDEVDDIQEQSDITSRRQECTVMVIDLSPEDCSPIVEPTERTLPPSQKPNFIELREPLLGMQ